MVVKRKRKSGGLKYLEGQTGNNRCFEESMNVQKFSNSNKIC